MRTVYILFLLSLFSISANDFDDLFSDIEMEMDSAEESPLSFSGEQKFIYSVPYIEPENFNGLTFENYFSLIYETENVEIVSNWNINIPDNEIVPDENYMKISANQSVFKLGYLLYSWGYADKKNPVNYLNSRDYSNPLDMKHLPALSLSYTQYFSDFSLEGVFIPLKEDSIVYNPLPYAFYEYEEYEKFIAGARLEYFGAIDLSLSYIYDLDDYYILTDDMELKNQRLHRVGVSIKKVLDSLGFWVESNYTITESEENYIEWVTGFDTNFGPESRGYMNIQYLGKYIQGFSDTDLTKVLQNSLSELQQGVLCSVSYQILTEELELELINIYLKESNYLGCVILKPSLDYTPIDALTITISGSYSYSLEDHPVYDDLHNRDSIGLTVIYKW